MTLKYFHLQNMLWAAVYINIYMYTHTHTHTHTHEYTTVTYSGNISATRFSLKGHHQFEQQ